MLVRKSLILLLLAPLAGAQTLDDAVRALARRIAGRLTPGETVRISGRSLIPAGTSEAPQARAQLEKILRRPPRADTQPVEIVLTVSENARGRLLVAEIRRAGDLAVEIAPYTPAAVTQASRPALEKRLVWEQDEQILDLALAEERMFVLAVGSVTRYTRGQGRWEAAETRPIPAPVIRDPRGRLELSAEAIAIHLPGTNCAGTWKPALELSCTDRSSEFALQGQRVRFSPGRNTLETESGEPFYSIARTGDAQIVSRPAAAPFGGWGSDFVAVENACSAGTRIIATAAGDRESADSATAYEIVAGKPSPASEAAQLPGPVTALWPAPGGALAVVRNLATGRYAAFSLTIDCGR